MSVILTTVPKESLLRGVWFRGVFHNLLHFGFCVLYSGLDRPLHYAINKGLQYYSSA